MLPLYFLFQPLYQERVWGGRRLGDFPGRTLPSPQPIGESWEIVDRPEAQSVVRDGPWAGTTLRELRARAGAELLGPRWPAPRPFPILVKWLDCRERLSLQVHPPAHLAPELKGEPKTENWYIAAAEPEASLIVGLRRGVTPEAFKQALATAALEPCVHRFGVKAGDSILVRSGTVHAIDAGNLILEIQQNSDTTYRVYDWGRVGLDGRPRALHVEESLRSIDFSTVEPTPRRGSEGAGLLAECSEFRLRRVDLRTGETLRFVAGEEARLLSIVSGSLRAADEELATPLVTGDNALIPYSSPAAWVASEATTALITDRFSSP